MKSNFIFLVLFTVFFQTVNSQTFEVDGITYQITNAVDLEVGVSAGCQAEVNIPDQVVFNSQAFTVVRIMDNAFNFCSTLTTLTLPNSLESIGEFAFNNNTNLTNFSIPSTVTLIEKGAFANCQSITSLDIPDGIVEIKERTFFGCNSLTNLPIPESVLIIAKEAFSGCDDLVNLTLPAGLTTIGELAFFACENLQNLNFTTALQTVGNQAFNSCKSFTQANLPNSVTNLGTAVFAYCFGITDIVNLPNTLSVLPNETFLGCIGLTDVVVPSNFTFIGDSAFNTCENLSSITIPNTVDTINESAFYNCYNLQTITLPDTLMSISQTLFFNSGLTELDIPNSVTSIGLGAFAACSDFTSVTIPNSVIQILDSAFSGTDLNTVFVDWEAPIVIEPEVFGSLNLANVTLIVPAATEAIYGTAAVWQDFGNITATYNNPISIPDSNFEQALIDLSIDSDGILNGQMFENDALGVTDLDVSNQNISDLTGIEFFTDLVTLSVADNNLSSLDVSIYTNLSSLLCQNNDLESLNVKNANNINFTSFNAQNNPDLGCITVDDKLYSEANWTSIDSQVLFTTDCTRTINIPDSNFEQGLVLFGYDSDGIVNGQMLEIDALGVTNLSLSSDNIADLTGIEFFIDLERLTAFNNNLSSINLSQNTKLERVSLANNNLASIDLSNSPNLEYLELISNIIVNLDVSQNPNLTTLFCGNNQLETLNVQNGNNINFTNFETEGNPNLTCIEVDDVNYSDTTWTEANPLFDFDMGIVFSIDCSAPQIINIPDSNFEQALINQNIDTDGVINGQVLQSDIIDIEFLNVSASNISNLTGIEGFLALETLFASGNNLTNINLSSNTNLTGLYAGINAIESIDLSTNTSLLALALGTNQLNNIDLSNNILLTQLFLEDNQLASIDISNLSGLSEVNLSENNLNELDLSQNFALTQIYCSDNDLFNLNVQNGNNNTVSDANFNASLNENLNCIQVDAIAYSDNNWTNIDSQSFFSLDCAPNNDDCIEAASLDLGTLINGTTFGSTSSNSSPSCQEDDIVLFDVWYQFTAPNSGLITAVATSVLNSLPINLAIYEDCNAVEPISCDSGTIAVTDLIPGNTYLIQIWVGGNIQGRSVLNELDEFTLVVQDTTLSTTDLEPPVSTVKLIPNPASNQTLITSISDDISSLQVFDLTGKKVLELSQINKRNQRVDISDLSKGMYLVLVKLDNATTLTKKLLIN